MVRMFFKRPVKVRNGQNIWEPTKQNIQHSVSKVYTGCYDALDIHHSRYCLFKTVEF